MQRKKLTENFSFNVRLNNFIERLKTVQYSEFHNHSSCLIKCRASYLKELILHLTVYLLFSVLAFYLGPILRQTGNAPKTVSSYY